MGNLLMQGVELMMLGMGIVFGFLVVLVFTLRGMSMLADRLADTAGTEATPTQQPLDVTDNRQLIAVISAAVARYRASRVA